MAKLYTEAEVAVMTERLDAEIAALRTGIEAVKDEIVRAIAAEEKADKAREAAEAKREAAEKKREAAEKAREEAMLRALKAEAKVDSAKEEPKDDKQGELIASTLQEILAEVRADRSADVREVQAPAPIVMPAMSPAVYEVQDLRRTADGTLRGFTLMPRKPH